ncbi:putative deoxyribonuclease TATDN3 isoform X3 [Pseudophryne corroboree]|uniref:putative deoxyribonuclease TATDN3 isoform X3 n=1 Tax=Pseudophryne corroboree TaxID=495146 RepID=UPI0030814C41
MRTGGRLALCASAVRSQPAVTELEPGTTSCSRVTMEWPPGALVDCHCHLSAADFSHDIDTVLEEAKAAGVQALVAVAEHSAEFDRLMLLSRRFPGLVFPCLGVHPVQGTEQQRSATLQDLEDALPLIERYKKELVAIGEVGLDFTPRIASTEEQKEEQRQVFIRQIQLAKQLDLPLNVHSRSAGRPTINLLKEQGAGNVLLHAFDGKPSVAMEGVKAGFYFSIPPSIIRSEQVRNEPKNITFSAEYIAKVKGVSLETVIEVTTKNALRLFPRLLHIHK